MTTQISFYSVRYCTYACGVTVVDFSDMVDLHIIYRIIGIFSDMVDLFVKNCSITFVLSCVINCIVMFSKIDL
jgi:hypothetical protein